MQELLEELGLSGNETKIYLYLLKKGSTTTGAIIKETCIANSQVYEVLNKLIAKGLVTYNVQKDGKHFQAANPEKFRELEDERKKKIESLIPNLINLQGKNQEETTTAIYEGSEGFKTGFKNIIDNCPENGTIYIIGFSEQQYAMKSLRTVINNLNLKSIEKNHKLKMILDTSVKKTFGRDRGREKNTEIKYMPEGFISPIAIDVIDEYVYMLLWEEKPYIFEIKNKKMADSFKVYFNFLWKIAKP